jgi:hypothetical protein
MIKTVIDLSARLGTARDQGQRPTCLVFAGSDLNAAAKNVGHLSVEFLCHHAAKLSRTWHPGLGFQMDHVLSAIRVPGQPLEALYPYQHSPNMPLTEPKGEFELHASPSARWQNMTTKEVVTHLTDGEPIGLVVQVCQALMTPTDGVINFDPLVLPDQYHAVLGVGLGTHSDTGQDYVLLRNSWGTSWGLAGHAWMPLMLLDILLVESFLI